MLDSGAQPVETHVNNRNTSSHFCSLFFSFVCYVEFFGGLPLYTRSQTPVPSSPFQVPRSQTPVPSSPFQVPRSKFPVPSSPFPVTIFSNIPLLAPCLRCMILCPQICRQLRIHVSGLTTFSSSFRHRGDYWKSKKICTSKTDRSTRTACK